MRRGLSLLSKQYIRNNNQNFNLVKSVQYGFQTTVCQSSFIGLTQLSNYQFAKVGKKKQAKMDLKNEKKDLSDKLDKKIDLNVPQKEFEASIEYIKKEYKKLQVGRLTPNSFSKFQVIAYGEKQPLDQVAQIGTKNETTCVLNVYDESLVGAVYKILENSGENYQLKREGQNIQVILLGGNTKEAKQNTIKEAQQLLTSLKTKLKNHRHKAMDSLKPYKKVTSADTIKDAENEIQEMYTKYNKQAEDLLKQKEKEIMKA